RKAVAKCIVLLLLGAFSAYGQNSSTPLTNETIIRLVVSGVPTDTVINTIRVSDSVSFGFLPGDLELLQRYHVPEDVVKAMAAKDAGKPIPIGGSAQPVQPSAPKQPLVLTEPPKA